jgi:hypothetical protein
MAAVAAAAAPAANKVRLVEPMIGVLLNLLSMAGFCNPKRQYDP